ncbi:MAG: TPM domain-containing protein [Alphaproteobacteria bacterium]
MCKPFITDEDRVRISEAVKRAELKTSGELVTVIARKSADYYFVPVLCSFFVAFIVPIIIFYTSNLMLALSVPMFVGGQALLAFTTFLLVNLRFIKVSLVPHKHKVAKAKEMARRQFLAQGLHLTKNKTGVLIFVSVSERYVEIMGDEGISAVVPEDYFEGLVSEFLTAVKKGKIADGFVSVAGQIGEKLSEKFPHQDDDENERPDNLIEV